MFQLFATNYSGILLRILIRLRCLILREPSCFHVFGIAVNMSDSSRRFVAKQRYDSVKYAECFLDSTMLGQTKSSKKIKPRRRYEVRVNRHDSRSSERTID